MEIFLGPLKEYMETLYGELLADKDSQDEEMLAAGGDTTDSVMPSSYRYDIEIEKSGVVELNLKVSRKLTINDFFKF